MCIKGFATHDKSVRRFKSWGIILGFWDFLGFFSDCFFSVSDFGTFSNFFQIFWFYFYRILRFFSDFGIFFGLLGFLGGFWDFFWGFSWGCTKICWVANPSENINEILKIWMTSYIRSTAVALPRVRCWGTCACSNRPSDDLPNSCRKRCRRPARPKRKPSVPMCR